MKRIALALVSAGLIVGVFAGPVSAARPRITHPPRCITVSWYPDPICITFGR